MSILKWHFSNNYINEEPNEEIIIEEVLENLCDETVENFHSDNIIEDNSDTESNYSSDDDDKLPIELLP